MRFLHLVGLCVAIPVAARVVRAAAGTAGWNLEFRYENDAGVVTLYAIGLLGVAVFTRVVWGISLRGSFAPYWAAWRRVLFGFGLAAGVTLAVLVLEYLVASWAGIAVWHSARWQRAGWPLAGRTLLALGAVVLIAAAEECMFRGVAFNYLRSGGTRSATIGAIFGSALLFALAHHIEEPAAWLLPSGRLLLVGLVLLGVLLAVVYLATGSLACAVGLHAGLLLVEVFARNKATRLVLLSQPDWWMGVNGDLRTAPVVWVQFIGLTVIVWWARGWARPLTAIESESPTADAVVTAGRGRAQPCHGP